MTNFPWALIEQWPANGQMKKLDKWGITAAHYPATSMRVERLVIVHDGMEYTRRKLGNKFGLPTVKKL